MSRTVSLAHLSAMRTDTRPALVEAGRFNRREIMLRAVAEARGIVRNMRLTWRRAMACALRTVWDAAKRQAGYQRAELRIAASYRTAEAPPAVLEPRKAAVRWNSQHTPRARVFVSGSRAFSHSW